MNSMVKSADLQVVEVEGSGTVSLPPDSLRTNVSVEVRGASLEAAREEAAAKTRAIVSALEGLQIPSLQVKNVDVSVSPISERETERESVAPPRIIGYEATSTVSVVLEGASIDVLRVESSRILEAALSAGANQTSGIRFFLSAPQEAYRAALKASIADAESNAGAIAQAAKIKLVGWRSVSTPGEEDGRRAWQMQMAAGRIGGSRSTTFPIEPEEIEVTASVRARFRFAKR
ncbi:SIMPL domain-containing protein [Sorangium sp. So ce861]|uniref:SIMPL domain-containing protein n=1 Tax=Sorangium sp. So ce861 TaxID=3133323 RepID=UPI003F617078